MEGDRAERPALGLVAADQLRGQVLRLCGAAAVPAGEQAPALEQAPCQLRAPAVQALGLELERIGGGAQGGEVLARGRDELEAPAPPRWAAGPCGEPCVDVERRRGDAVPVVQAPCPAHAGAAPLGACVVVREHTAQHLREALGVAGRDVDAGHAVDDRVDHPADGRGDHRHATGHRLQRHDPERLVPGNRDHGVRGADEGRQVLARHAPAQLDAVGDARASRDVQQPARLGVVGEAGPIRSADDDELRVRHAGQRLDRVADALALHEPADAQQPRHAGWPRVPRAVRPEAAEVDAAGDRRSAVRASAPRRTSSKTSSVHVATTWSADAASPRSISSRCGGLVSFSP